MGAKESYKYFTSSGSWIAPPGVTIVRLYGWGGGGGAGGGDNGAVSTFGPHLGGAGGGGSIAALVPVVVVPNTSYTITIGAGGAGGAVRADGSVGGVTSFGTLAYFQGASAGGAGENSDLPGAPITAGGSTCSTTSISGAGGVGASNASDNSGLG